MIMKKKNNIKDKMIFIGDYLLSFPGGAERSIYRVLKELSKKNEIKAITFDPKHSKGKFDHEGIHVINYGLKTNLGLSRFITTYCINEKFFLETLKKNMQDLKKAEYVIVQALFGPLAANFLKKNNIPYHYYLRDEHQLNIFNNYERGFKHFLKFVKNIVEFYPISKYKRLNKNALQYAKKIIANSQFMKNTLKERFGLKSEVVLPNIDKKHFMSLKKKTKDREFITFVGGENAMKGSVKRFLYISTANVFDGTKDGEYNERDICRPLNMFGMSKWKAEQEIMKLVRDY